jgi:hypothetical protein
MPVPSAETQKLVKMYAKEGYRQVAYYTKRGLRSAATGFTIARAIANKLDIAGQSMDSMQGDDEPSECLLHRRRCLHRAVRGACKQMHVAIMFPCAFLSS